MATALEIPVLTGPRVTLRPHTLDDLGPVLERCLDPESVRWTTVPSPYTEDMARDYLARISQPSPDQISWAIEQDQDYVGSIDLRPVAGEGERRCGDVGFVTHPQARGRGVMTEAVALVIDHAFGSLGWELLVWQANVGNVASYKPMWRNGFPVPLAVPALLDHRGTLLDGWHSVLEPDMPRHPRQTWDEAHAALLQDMTTSRRPG
ncbi:GNAT family N-acetyltransferase [Ornithinimicrobium panacihumi]|uniref:GNAT family N-acetyltransferase n=1 Tax=Ornithinimicrobium panacihumi TaxID=2008449 RepID=UPI003F895F29